jgi:hypothetical protein
VKHFFQEVADFRSQSTFIRCRSTTE